MLLLLLGTTAAKLVAVADWCGGVCFFLLVCVCVCVYDNVCVPQRVRDICV